MAVRLHPAVKFVVVNLLFYVGQGLSYFGELIWLLGILVGRLISYPGKRLYHAGQVLLVAADFVSSDYDGGSKS